MTTEHPAQREDLRGEVRIQRLSIQVGRGAQAFTAVKHLDFSVRPGEFVCVLGPSGCGKSTLLGVLAGHIQPSEGHASLDGEPISGPHPQRGMVFQHHTLFPWKKTLQNVAFGLKMRGVPRAQRHERAMDLLRRVGLGDFAHHYPSQLSGGMQQRAEIARVMINAPRILLMDEPFGALDAQTRAMMQELLLDVWTERRTTVVFVTHDVDEALFLGDRILIMGARQAAGAAQAESGTAAGAPSPRPGTLLEDIPVPFARPRRREIVTSPEFAALKRHCLELLQPQRAGSPLPRLSPLGQPPYLATQASS